MRKVSSVLAPALFVGSILFVGTTLVCAGINRRGVADERAIR